jgi:uncharacterized protein
MPINKVETQGLQYNVAQLLKDGTGGSRIYNIETKATGGFDSDITIVSAITGKIRLLCTGRNILVTGELEAMVMRNCGRCLTEFTASTTVELEEEFFPSIDIHTGGVLKNSSDVDDTNLIDEQHILDLNEIVRQEFMLANETVRYCRSDCLGLCPQCGQDHNTAPCDCKIEAIDSRWADLLAIKEKED